MSATHSNLSPAMAEQMQLLNEHLAACRRGAAQIDAEFYKLRWIIWFRRLVAFVSLSGSVAAVSSMGDFRAQGETALCVAMGVIAVLNFGFFVHSVYTTETVLHGLRTSRRTYERLAGELSEFIGKLTMDAIAMQPYLLDDTTPSHAPDAAQP